MEINKINKENVEGVRKYIPWDKDIEKDDSKIFIGKKKGEIIGSIKLSTLGELPWLEISLEENGKKGSELIKRYLESDNINNIYSLVSENEKNKIKSLENLNHKILAEFKYAKAFSFPYKENIQEVEIPNSLKDTKAYKKTSGLYLTKEQKVGKIDDKNILGLKYQGKTVGLLRNDGKRQTKNQRQELFFGFTWCNERYASKVALGARSKAYQKDIDDVLVCLPDDLYTSSFEQSGFNIEEKIYLYKIEI